MSTELVTIDQVSLDALGYSEEQLAVMGQLGMENARPEDFQIPRLQISQAMSPQLVRSKPEYIPGLMVGQLFNTVTQENYGDTITVAPVKFSVSRLNFMNSVLDCQSKNGVDGGHHAPVCAKCPLAAWGSGKDGQGTACKEYRNWLLLDSKDGSPMSFSFKSASLTIAKTWATLVAGRKIKLASGQAIPAPAFMTTYEIRTAEKSTTKGTFFVPQIRVVGPTEASLVKLAAELYKSFKGEIISDVGHDD